MPEKPRGPSALSSFPGHAPQPQAREWPHSPTATGVMGPPELSTAFGSAPWSSRHVGLSFHGPVPPQLPWGGQLGDQEVSRLEPLRSAGEAHRHCPHGARGRGIALVEAWSPSPGKIFSRLRPWPKPAYLCALHPGYLFLELPWRAFEKPQCPCPVQPR